MKKITESMLILAVCIMMIGGFFINLTNYVFVFSIFLCLSVLIKDSITLFIKVTLLFVVFIPTEIYNLPIDLDGIFGKLTFVTCFVTVYVILFFLFFDNRLKYRVLNSSIQILFFTFVLYACLVTLRFRGFIGIPLILNNFVIPFILFKLIYEKLDAKSVTGILNFYVAIAVISATYGIAERIVQFNYLYDFIFRTFPWYMSQTRIGAYRIFSTIGHPLQVSVFYLSTLGVIPFSKFKNSIGINAIMVLAVVFTGSRTGMALGILFVFIRVMYESFVNKETNPNGNEIKKMILFTMPMLLLAFAYKMGVFDFTLSRFTGGAASTEVRTIAVRYITSHYRSYIIGKGMKASYGVAKSFFGANHFFENCWVSLIVDVGFIGFTLYLTSIIAICLMNIPLSKKLYKKVKEADGEPTIGKHFEVKFNMFIFILLFMAAISSFDSISLLCNLNYIFFIFIALMNSLLSNGNGPISVRVKGFLNTEHYAT
jgi:hypothetical protein